MPQDGKSREHGAWRSWQFPVGSWQFPIGKNHSSPKSEVEEVEEEEEMEETSFILHLIDYGGRRRLRLRTKINVRIANG
jgi:hypothetical protein